VGINIFKKYFGLSLNDDTILGERGSSTNMFVIKSVPMGSISQKLSKLA